MGKKIINRKIAVSSSSRVDDLYLKISSHIESAKKTFQRTVDIEMVKAYWLIGRDIIKEEQHGKIRAEYGSYLLDGK